MTLEQVAEQLHCSTKTVRRRITSGELRASHLGRGLWQIRVEDLDAYLDAAATRPREVRPLPANEPVEVRRHTRRRGGSSSQGLSELVREMGPSQRIS